MSDEGEKTCPLCAEEMDLTDQQLKPCKCGYEICVWCWHHIMDMAEKDDSEGRCPACRTPYDKEKIVGTGPNERLVSEINERKKSHKSKTKPSDGRKLLSTVRVIQRNLVYIVGLPLNFADEDLLQRREYFGQYGKVLKVSISRTAAGVIQQFPNNTCSVYITYGKEKEAIRCIQSVHGFVLDGRSLKACFGTTKYCHAWLRNVPCTNSDCLYLHEVGSQEDSFTKDEIISAYTRSKVQQITGATSNLVRRSGSMLPLPPDDYSYGTLASTEKPIVKGATNQSTTANSGKGLSPNGSYSGSAALPAAASWGMRGSNQPQNVTNDPSKPKPKPDTVTSTVGFPSAVTSTMQSAASLGEIVKKTTWNEDGQPLKSKGKPDLLRPIIQLGGDCRHIMPVKASICNTGANNIELTKDSGTADVSSVKSSLLSFSHTQEDHANSDGKSLSLHSEMSSMEKDNGATGGASGRVTRISSVHSENCAVKSSSGQKLYVEQHGQHGESIHSTGCESATSRLFVSEDENVCRMDPQTRVVADNVRELEVDLISFDNQRQSDPEVVSHTSFLSSSANLLQTEKDFWSRSLQHSNALSSVDVKAGPLFIDPGIAENQMSLPNGCPEKPMNGFAGIDRNGEYPRGRKHSGRLKCNSDGNEAVDAGESSIISDILSLDLDGWDESLTSQNLAKLLGDTDKQTSSLKMSNSRKAENSKQSRFSFARQEESRDQTPDVDLSFVGLGQIPRNHSFNHDLLESRNTYLHKHGMSNGFSSSNMDQPKSFVGATSAFPSISRAQISAPPGFSVPNRAPPPGFSSHERVDQTYNGISVNHILDTSSLHESSYQAPMTGSMGSTIDIELNDPAILAVGKGRPQGLLNNPGFDIRSNFPQQLNSYEDEARLQLLMHRSLPQHQNLVLDNFSSMADSYGISSRIMDQSQVNNLSAFAQLSLPQSRKGAVSNGHWDGWNNGGNSLGMAELLHNEKFGGLNKLYSTGYDDSKFRMQSSGDLYNRTFEM